MKTEDIDYRAGDLTMRGFLAYDEAIAGKRPGVLVFPEAFGLSEHAMERAKMLASLGYVAFAGDLYGSRRVLTDMSEALKLTGDLRANLSKLRARAGAAIDTLSALPQVDKSRLGAIGFCFGGTTVLELARAGYDLAGVVSFHGGLGTSEPAGSGAVKAGILVCTGDDDPMIPPEQVAAFEAEMRHAEADWRVITYGNTLHSFTNPAADGSLAPAILYNERTDRRSWVAMTSFFEEVFA